MMITPGLVRRCSAPSAATPTAALPGWVMRRCARRWPRRQRSNLPDWPERVTPHVLRHFCASQLYLGGMDLVAIQQALGHAWVATTMNYIHVHDTHVEDAWVTGQQRAADRLKGLLP